MFQEVTVTCQGWLRGWTEGPYSRILPGEGSDDIPMLVMAELHVDWILLGACVCPISSWGRVDALPNVEHYVVNVANTVRQSEKKVHGKTAMNFGAVFLNFRSLYIHSGTENPHGTTQPEVS